MKKITSFFIVICMCMVLVGCSSGNTELVMTTGGTTGVYYSFGGELATIYSQKMENVNVTVQSSGGSKANVLALAEGEAEIGIVQNDVMSYAYAGTEDFGNKSVECFSAIASLFPEVVQVVVAKDSGITKVEDLKGKNVAIGAIGSGAYFNAVHILDAVGLTLDDIKVQYLSFSESSEAFQNNQIDAYFVTSPYPHTSITDASLKKDINILTLSSEQMKVLQEKYEFYVTDTIPAGTYAGVDTDVVVPAVSAVLVVHNSLDEDTVYELTKGLFENISDITNAKKQYITLENAVKGVPTSSSDVNKGVQNGSFHPGALKYYKEMGILE